MGNDLSCINSSVTTLPTPNAGIARQRSRALITIVSPSDGRACRFKEPLNVGELLLEMPGHFVGEFGRPDQDGYMLRSRRISALPADSNLCALHVYYLLPMNRLNTHLAAHELRKIAMASRLAPPYPAPYNPLTPKVMPLPSLHCQESVMHNAKKRHASNRGQVLHRRRQSPRGRTYRGEKVQRDKVEKRGGEGGGDDGGLVNLPTQRAVTYKPRPWVPKLDTIKEIHLEL